MARAHTTPHRKSQPRRRTESVTRKQTHTCNDMTPDQLCHGLAGREKSATETNLKSSNTEYSGLLKRTASEINL